MTLTDKLDMLLSERGLNRKQFSEQSGIPYMTIVNFYEKGTENVKLSTLRKIANYFNVTLDFIADDDFEVSDISADRSTHDSGEYGTTGEQISDMRKEKNITLEELSELSGVPISTIKKISAGITKKPSIETVKALVYAMGFTLEDLENKKSPAPESEAEKDEGEAALIDNYRKLNDKGRRRLLEMSADMVAGGRYEPFDPETQIKIGVAAVGRGPHRVIRDKDTVIKAQEEFFEKKEDMDWHPPIK